MERRKSSLIALQRVWWTSLIEKKPVPKDLDTGVVMVTKENIDKPVAKNVLY